MNIPNWSHIPNWLQSEENAMKSKVIWQRCELWLIRVDTPYGNPSFVVSSPDGDMLFDDGQKAIERVRELRAKFGV